MSSIATAIELTDRMSYPLQSITSALNSTLNVFEDFKSSVGESFDDTKINSARVAIDSANASIEAMKENIKKGGNEQKNFNNKVDETAQKMNNATNASNSFFKSLMGFGVIQKVFNMVTGQIGAAMNRMDTMTNFQRTMTAITGSSDAAKASLGELKNITKGTAYGLDVAASSAQNFVTRGMGIASATREVGKWADAVSFYGNGTNEQLSSVTDALGKMLSKGKVEMDQLNRLTDAGINAVGIYAQATGQSSSIVQKNLTAGKITSQDFITTVSTAFEEGTNGVLKIAGAAKEAGGTWATSIANMKAAVTRGIISVVDSINNALTKAGFGTILDGITNFGSAIENFLGNIGNFIGGIITLLAPVFNIIQQIGSFISDNWSIIAPIVTGIAIAFGMYNSALVAHAIFVGISTAAEWLHSIATYAQATALLANVNATLLATSSEYALAVATAQATVAQGGFNATLLACPIVWIVLLVIAFIAAIYAAVAAINKWKGTTISATGIICSTIALAGAIIYNTFVGIVNAICKIIDTVANGIISVIEWVLNVCCGGFDDFGGAVANLIGNIISWFLNLGTVVTTIIDAIFGTDWTAGLNSLANTVQQWGKNEKSITLERWDHSLERIDYQDAVNAGYKFGQGIDESVGKVFNAKDMKNNLTKDLMSNLEAFDNNDIANKIGGNTGRTADNTGAINDTLSATEEDLKYLRDIAEREVINRFTTAEIKIDMTNHNSINSEADLDGIINSLSEGLYETMEMAAEGVHE